MAKTEKQGPAEARVVWLYAEAEPKPTYDSLLVGKWQIFVPRTAINRVWEELAEATQRGDLGISSKVSGTLSNPNAHDPNSHVIVLYAADWRNLDDLRRMLRRIREAGVEQAIYFKRDRETLAGQYSKKDKPIVSVWGSPSGDTIRSKWIGNAKAWVEINAENQEHFIERIKELDESD